MQISKKAWMEYIQKMSAISKKAADEMQNWIARHGFADDQAMLEYAYSLATHYGEAIAALSCQMYESTAAAQGVVIRSAEPAPTPKFGEVAKAVHGTMKESLNKVPGTVGRMVKQTGADTTLLNAKRDGIWFAWISQGDTCPYCLMMSAIGWQRAGKKTLQGGHADHIHPNCDCQYAIDFKGDMTIEGYDPEKLQDEIMAIIDPDGKEDVIFEDFLNHNGRASSKRRRKDLYKLRIKRKKNHKNNMVSLSRIHVNKNENLYEYLKYTKPIDGYEDFAIHGSVEESKVEYETSNGIMTKYSAEEYADMIKTDPDYNGGKIRLLSCGMGSNETDFSQRLANALGKEVLSPSETLWVREDGKLFISDNETLAEMWYYGDEKIKETGEWVSFTPE